MEPIHSPGGFLSALLILSVLSVSTPAQSDLSPVVNLGQQVTETMSMGGSWFATHPGITTSIQAIAGRGSGSAQVTNVSFFYRGAKIREETAAIPDWRVFYLDLTEFEIGEFPLSVVATDSAGRIGRNDGWLRVSNDQISIVPPSAPILIGDQVALQVKTTPTNWINTIYLDSRGSRLAELVARPYRLTWNPAEAGLHVLQASSSLNGQNHVFFYHADIRIPVLPSRLPLVLQATNFPYFPRGASTTLAPTILSRDRVTVQWLHNGSEIPSATNETLTLSNLTESDQGAYTLHVENFAGTLSADVASIEITDAEPTGGAILFRNRANGIDAPVREYMPDGPFLDASAKAQLYGGPSLLEMRAVGPIVRFNNGYFNGGTVRIPTVPPGQVAYVQVYAWKNLFSNEGSFETARSSGNWAKSDILQITTVPAEVGGAPLTGLQPFGLLLWDAYALGTRVSSNAVARVGSTLDLNAWGRGLYTWTHVERTNIIFQWSKDGAVLPGITQSNLTLVNIQPRDAGIYRVAITDGLDIKVHPITIAVDSTVPILRATRGPSGALNWRLDAQEGVETVIQISDDLRTWRDWKTFTGASGIFISDPPFAGVSGFIRAVNQ